MSFKDRFDRLIDYFTEDGDEYDVQEAPAQAVGASQPVASPKPVQPSSKPRQKSCGSCQGAETYSCCSKSSTSSFYSSG